MNTPDPGNRQVVFSADDLGLTRAINQGVLRAHTAGVLTSTCLMAVGPEYPHARDDILPRCPNLGLGVHLTTEGGPPISRASRLPDLVDREGTLACGFVRLWRLCRRPAVRGQLKREFAAQIERVLDDGLLVDHLNGHRHIQMIPAIFRMVCELADEYGIGFVRLVREPPHRTGGIGGQLSTIRRGNLLKHHLLNRMGRVDQRLLAGYRVKATERLLGVLHSGRMDVAHIMAGLRACLGGCVEVVTHVAHGDPDPVDSALPPGLAAFVGHPNRRVEAEALASPQLRRFLTQQCWSAVNFRRAPDALEPLKSRLTAGVAAAPAADKKAP
ncbi:MAG: ChbG/HpnK family deacetylase [Planctomycetes bacterium]|nr:ChbG/HpnK family deacetylase [Planctomycetota bacterium]